MKSIKFLLALALGVVASSSGVLQVNAAEYVSFVDFSTKEVANFTDFKQTFNEDTSNLNLEVNFNFNGTYKFDSCPTLFTVNIIFQLYSRINATGAYTLIGEQNLPDMPCTTIDTFYEIEKKVNLSSTYLDTVVNDDANFIEFAPNIIFRNSASTIGRTLSLSFYQLYFDLTYDFGTTYLFNYFLSDQRFVQRIATGSWTFNQTQANYLNYVYTTAGNDVYKISNTNNSSIGTTRKKYAIDDNFMFYRGQSVGAGFTSVMTGLTPDRFIMGGPGGAGILEYRYYYYYLNVANNAQAIVDAPIIGFTEEVCSGGFLDINVGCYVNNAFAYIVNDAPVISDAFTLLNTGIELAAQTFGIIGNFSDDNVFGYLILVGFGFIAVKWFLKNDE
jgi:hypothetical protein